MSARGGRRLSAWVSLSVLLRLIVCVEVEFCSVVGSGFVVVSIWCIVLGVVLECIVLMRMIAFRLVNVLINFIGLFFCVSVFILCSRRWWVMMSFVVSLLWYGLLMLIMSVRLLGLGSVLCMRCMGCGCGLFVRSGVAVCYLEG